MKPKKRNKPVLGSVKSTSRGFALVEFLDSYHEPCSLQHSSAIDPHVWLGCEHNSRPSHTTTEPISPRMHLSKIQVEALVGHLQRWLKYRHF